MDKIEDAVRRLEELRIPYELVRCKPAETMEMLTEIGLEQKGVIGKNLFLRDAKGRRHFLVFVYGDKKVDLAALKDKIGSTRLSFGSAERLESHLGLLKGSVSPLGVLYNTDADV
ncbi:MAG TPA: YbaK/EbsC family protein, partial [Oscillospiraceae bacterium]|nr:YbaK/EbsC family protein [Oscillospiraceae bacterium]